jgi:hypothetical protein
MNGLSAMMRFLSAGAAAGAGLGAAEVFGAWKFVARIVDHFIGLDPGRGVGAKAGNLAWKNCDYEQQERFEQQRSQQAAVGKDAVRRFTGEARAGAGEGRTDGGDEFLPARRPLDQQFGRVVKFDDRDVFELESFRH